MAYQKTVWVNGNPPALNAENLNKIEGGIEAAHQTADAVQADLAAHKAASPLDHPDGSVTDAKIGNRTADQTQAPTGSTGTLAQLLSWLANRIKAITGKANWFDNPDTSLAAAAAHIAAAAPHSGHETPAGAQAKVDAHATRTDNPHQTTAAQVGAVAKTGDTMTGPLEIASWGVGARVQIRDTDGPLDQKIWRIEPTSGALHISRYNDDNATGAAFAAKFWNDKTVEFAVTPKVGTYPVWHAGNDGAGSGLDADKVDGKEPGVANGLATLNASGLVAQDSSYTSGVSGFTPASVKAALDALALAKHATNAISAFRAYQSSAQSLTGGTFNKVLFQTEVYDQRGEYDPSTSRFTAGEAGIYLFSVAVKTPGVSSYLALYVNGVEHSGISSGTEGGGSVAVKLNAGNYVEVYCYPASSVTTEATSARVFFSGVRLA